jgi:hypothetical protein
LREINSDIDLGCLIDLSLSEKKTHDRLEEAGEDGRSHCDERFGGSVHSGLLVRGGESSRDVRREFNRNANGLETEIEKLSFPMKGRICSNLTLKA